MYLAKPIRRQPCAAQSKNIQLVYTNLFTGLAITWNSKRLTSQLK